MNARNSNRPKPSGNINLHQLQKINKQSSEIIKRRDIHLYIQIIKIKHGVARLPMTIKGHVKEKNVANLRLGLGRLVWVARRCPTRQPMQIVTVIIR